MALLHRPVPLAALIAMSVGVIFTVAFAVGLMGLFFRSNRSGYDDAVCRGGVTDEGSLTQKPPGAD